MFDITRTATLAPVRTLTLASALLLLPAGASFAQGAYGVLANVQTLGMPGGSSNYSNGLALDTYEYRESDPAGGYMGTQPGNTVFADGAARAWAQQGEMRVKTDATANHLSATNLPGSYPYGFAETRYWDTVTVTSETLPVNTPVTLIFRTDLVLELSGSGAFAGTFYAENVVAGRSVSLQQTFSNLDMDYTTLMSSLVIQTKVGARFTMSGRAYLNTRAHYSQLVGDTRIWDGTVSGDLTVKPVFESASADAQLVADSGVVYLPLTTN